MVRWLGCQAMRTARGVRSGYTWRWLTWPSRCGTRAQARAHRLLRRSWPAPSSRAARRARRRSLAPFYARPPLFPRYMFRRGIQRATSCAAVSLPRPAPTSCRRVPGRTARTAAIPPAPPRPARPRVSWNFRAENGMPGGLLLYNVSTPPAPGPASRGIGDALPAASAGGAEAGSPSPSRRTRRGASRSKRRRRGGSPPGLPLVPASPAS